MNQPSGWLRNNHTLLMIICCAAPMIVLAAVLVFNVPLSTVALFGIMLLCPLMHVFMMRGMGHGEHSEASCHGDTQPSGTAMSENKELQASNNGSVRLSGNELPQRQQN